MKIPNLCTGWQLFNDAVHALNLSDNAFARPLPTNYIPVFYGKADNHFYFGITPNLSSLFTFQGFRLILCSQLCVERAQAPGLASTGIFSFFVCIQALLCIVDLIREAGAQIQRKQLYFNVTGIRFAEERILKWDWTRNI